MIHAVTRHIDDRKEAVRLLPKIVKRASWTLVGRRGAGWTDLTCIELQRNLVLKIGNSATVDRFLEKRAKLN